MKTEILRKIGLTEGEIRVYEALAHLGKSSTGPIMNKSKISSSKVYLILEKLIQKGLVSFVIENNVKKFQVANPQNIIEYLDEQQKDLEAVKKESQDLIEELAQILGKYEEETAQIYKGFAGLRVAFNNLLEDIGNKGEFLFFAQSKEELENEKVKLFFKNLHQKRIERGIKTKGIADLSLKGLFTKEFLKQEKYEMKFSKLTLPMALSMGKKIILLNIWDDNPVCFEIISKRIAQRHREFFYRLWNVI